MPSSCSSRSRSSRGRSPSLSADSNAPPSPRHLRSGGTLTSSPPPTTCNPPPLSTVSPMAPRITARTPLDATPRFPFLLTTPRFTPHTTPHNTTPTTPPTLPPPSRPIGITSFTLGPALHGSLFRTPNPRSPALRCSPHAHVYIVSDGARARLDLDKGVWDLRFFGREGERRPSYRQLSEQAEMFVGVMSGAVQELQAVVDGEFTLRQGVVRREEGDDDDC